MTDTTGSVPLMPTNDVIARYGSVTISEHGVVISEFHFNGVGGNDAQALALAWARQRLDAAALSSRVASLSTPERERAANLADLVKSGAMGLNWNDAGLAPCNEPEGQIESDDALVEAALRHYATLPETGKD